MTRHGFTPPPPSGPALVGTVAAHQAALARLIEAGCNDEAAMTAAVATMPTMPKEAKE